MRSTAALYAGWARGHANLPGPYPSGEPLPVTFPAAQLVTRVQIALGADFTADPSTWAWQDITPYLRYADWITTTCGRLDEASTSDTKTARLRLANPGGIFVRRNPDGPYYGLLSKNTPIWITVDAGDGERTRFEGYVNEWPTRWDKSGNDSTVPIACSGVMRRLTQGSTAYSAMRRTIIATDPVEYWPLEDGSAATAGASAVTGGSSIVAPGVAFAQHTDLVGATVTPDMTAGHLIGTVTGGSSSAWWFGFAMKCPYVTSMVVRVYAGGIVFRVAWPTAVGTAVTVFIETSLTLTSVAGPPATAGFDTSWHYIAVSAEQSGTDVITKLYVDGVLYGSATDTSPNTLAAVNRVLVNQNTVAMTSVAHIAVGDGTAVPAAADALDGYAGEQAHVRLARVCDEVSVPFASLAGQSVAMGPQPVSSTVQILRDCEIVDQGFLYEAGFGIGYQSNAERANAPVAFTVDFDLGQIAESPEPADDDQRTRNRWTSSRDGGSEATVEDAASVAADGLYDVGGAVGVNVQSDGQLGSDAGWHVRMGTVDEDRWPHVPLRFSHSPELIPAWQALTLGARMNALHPPPETAPDTIDAFIEGWTERWNPHQWEAALNTSPAAPYDVGKLALDVDSDPLLGWLDWDSCTLHTAVDASATSWQIDATPLDTTVANDFLVPRPCRIGGEDITVTICTGASSPQTWTVVRSVNGVVSSHAAGTAIKLSRPVVLTL